MPTFKDPASLETTAGQLPDAVATAKALTFPVGSDGDGSAALTTLANNAPDAADSGSGKVGIPSDLNTVGITTSPLSGGVGNSSEISNLHDALDNINTRLMALRYHTAKAGATSPDGTLVDLMDANTSPLADGALVLAHSYGGANDITLPLVSTPFVWDRIFSELVAPEAKFTIAINGSEVANDFEINVTRRVENMQFNGSNNSRWTVSTADTHPHFAHCIFESSVNIHTGTFEDCHFDNSSTGYLHDDGVLIENPTTVGDLPHSIAFKRCHFEGIPDEGAGGGVVKVDHTNGTTTATEIHVVFDGCRFTANSATSENPLDMEGLNAFDPDDKSTYTFNDCFFDGTNLISDAFSGEAVSLIDIGAKVVFNNCTFVSGNCQVAYIQDSNVTFNNCHFSSQTSVFKAGRPVIAVGGFDTSTLATAAFNNCTAEWGTSNVDASGAPTGAVFDFGGHGSSTHRTGQILVDGFKFTSTTASVHNYTTVILRSGPATNTTKRPSSYRDITIDMDGAAPNGTGTLSSLSGSNGPILEMYGVASNTNLPVAKFEDIRILNVGEPTSNHARQICGISNRAYVDGLDIQGSNLPTNSYADELIRIIFDSTLRRLRINQDPSIYISTNVAIVDLNSRSNLYDSVITQNSSVTPGVCVFLDPNCRMRNCVLQCEGNLTDYLLQLNGADRGSVSDCYFLVNGTSNTAPMIFVSGTAEAFHFVNNTCVWEDTSAATMFNFSNVSEGVVMGNTFHAFTSAPGITYSGTGIGSNTLNVEAVTTDAVNMYPIY